MLGRSVRHGRRGARNRLADARISAAATDVWKRRDCILGWGRRRLQECSNRHDEAWLAIAAHCDLLRDPGLLNRMRSVRRQALDRGHARTLQRRERLIAARSRAAVDDDRARAAVVAVAAIFRAGQIRCIAQRPQERRLRIEPIFHCFAVDRHFHHGAQASLPHPLLPRRGMARVTISNRGAIGYEEAGGGGATPLIFLHGVGSDKSVWRPQLHYFSGDRRCVAFDYPGYGESSGAAEDTTRDDYARAIFAAMDALGIARAHICGLSLGGVIAIAMHAESPERAASLVLADSFAVHPEGAALYERSLGGSGDMRALAEARTDFLLAQPADPALRAEVIETMARIPPAAYVVGARAVWLADQHDRARNIRVPTLVLCGSEDKPTPPALSLALAKLIPGARYEAIDRAGHLTNLEQPDAFNHLVGAFIEEIDDGR